MRTTLASIVMGLLCAGLLAKPAERKDLAAPNRAVAEQGTTVPANVPLNARLIANETVYRLDRGGLSEEDYRKKLDLAKATGRLLAPPRVDVVFELQNTGKEEMQILVGGDTSGVLRWQLRGPGAVSQTVPSAMDADELRAPTVVKLAPGATHRWVFRELDASGPRDTTRAYWTRAGDYLLSAGFTVAVKPAPRGSVPHWYHKDHGNVAITSGPVRISVLEK
jgi:hypothetical protein